MDSIPSTVANVPCATVSAETNTPAVEIKPKTVYSNDNRDFSVETANSGVKAEVSLNSETEPLPSAYQWKKRLTVRVKRLSDFDINLWCNTPCNPDSDNAVPVETSWVKTEMTPAVHAEVDHHRMGSKRKLSNVETEPDVRSTSYDSEETTTQLIARANKLINRMSSALNASQETVPQLDSSTSQPPATSLNVETAVVRPKRSVKCKLCTFSCDSVHGLNEHHKEDHGIVTCSTCGKNFETKTALDKHMYCHTKLAAFCCEECGQSFPFKSRLIQHKITHTQESLFLCKHDS